MQNISRYLFVLKTKTHSIPTKSKLIKILLPFLLELTAAPNDIFFLVLLQNSQNLLGNFGHIFCSFFSFFAFYNIFLSSKGEKGCAETVIYCGFKDEDKGLS